jgi:hypothetical protein
MGAFLDGHPTARAHAIFAGEIHRHLMHERPTQRCAIGPSAESARDPKVACILSAL